MAEYDDGKNEHPPSEETPQGEYTQPEGDDLLHKFYMFGLGLSKEIGETVSKLSERGKTETDDKDKTLDDVLKKAREKTGLIENKLEDLVKRGLERMNLVTKERFDALEKRVEELEKKMTRGY